MWDVRLGRGRQAMEEVRAARLKRAKSAAERRRARGAQRAAHGKPQRLWEALSTAVRHLLRRTG